MTQASSKPPASVVAGLTRRAPFVHRRDAIRSGATLAAWMWARPMAAFLPVDSRPLPIPHLLEPDEEGAVELVMRAGKHEFRRGIAADTNGFNGAYLGPTVRVRSGQDVNLCYRNDLDESVAVHGHGLHVSGELDGGPQREIAPGESWSPVLPIRQRAATTWYHPHTHGRTGPQVYRGLAGLLIIDDEEADALPLPKTYGVDDLPVIVQDRTFDRKGRLVYEPTQDEDGFLADTIIVNGVDNATAAVPAGLVRLRLLNASNARFYRFRFADGRTFHKIATDGGLLERAVPIRDMAMVPGERNEIVVDLGDGRPALLVSSNTEFNGESRWSWRDRRRDDWSDWGPGGLGDAFRILELTVDGGLPAVTGALPRPLSDVQRPSLGDDEPARLFELAMEMDRDGPHRHQSMGINGRPMDLGTINERVPLGKWERWRIESEDGSHPFHIHGCSFFVLSQNGRRVSDDNAGWKDTVWVDDDAELLVRFDHPATERFPYMYHCHILEHEDRGMMGQFIVRRGALT